MSIKDNVAGRKLADEAYSLMSEYIQEVEASPEAKGIAFRTVGDLIDELTRTERNPEPSVAEAMTDEEAKRFERSSMPFGKHEGLQMKDVPLSYLQFIDGDEWRADLRRYMKRRDVWEEQEAS